jgi:hypothetical protein
MPPQAYDLRTLLSAAGIFEMTGVGKDELMLYGVRVVPGSTLLAEDALAYLVTRRR